METIWFAIIGFMLSMYVVLDGFDLGAGIVHFIIGRNEDDRRTIIRAIGPFWDGNEVWLLAAGGTLYMAFPLLYASSFSGFYLPLIMVLWLLMLRGLGIEFRHSVHHPLWVRFWDFLFSAASMLLAIFFGAALGNVVRGVPLNQDGYFFEPLWTTFTVVPEAGILDWYTVVMGLVALFTLTVHGCNFLAMKTQGGLQERARGIAFRVWWATVVSSVTALVAASSIRPQIWDNYLAHPWGFVFPLIGLAGTAGMLYYNRHRKDLHAFLSSSAFIGGMLASTAFGMYPSVLPASTNPDFGLTIYDTAAQHYGLSIGLTWWILGILLAAGYFTFAYRTFHGKVSAEIY